MMTKARKVLLSGIVSPDFNIDRFVHSSPDLMHYQLQGENSSAFEFIHEDDRERIMIIVERSVTRNQAETVTLRTKMLVNVFQLDITATFCPFFNGDGSLKHYGFVVTDMQPVSGEVDSSVQLKVLMARANKSAQQLASDTGISLQTISKLRNGKISKPQRLTAELIAAELGVSPQEIWPNS
jgi:DNA-binding Xre family transcriptional regulator